mgnify:CR=1 FL=1
MVVDILGTEYKIYYKTDEEEPYLETCDGFCDRSRKEIVIAQMQPNPDTYQVNLEWYRKKVLRHEIIHAFLHESGLEENSNSSDNWSGNEEMVDWIAIQFSKILIAFQKADCL